MLRPDKKYSVYDLRQLKGKCCLIYVQVKSPEEAAAAEAAGIDLMSCSFDTPASQARLPLLVAAAPKSFISAATPHGLASYFCKKTSMILMSLGSGSGCDTQFLFSDDILQDYDERIPRHAKAYRNFRKEYQQLQNERLAAFAEYAEDVKSGRFPEASQAVAMDEAAFKAAVEAIERIDHA